MVFVSQFSSQKEKFKRLKNLKIRCEKKSSRRVVRSKSKVKVAFSILKFVKMLTFPKEKFEK